MKPRATPGNTAHRSADSEEAIIARAQEAERQGKWGTACSHYERLIRNTSTSPANRLAVLRWLGRAYLENGNRAAALDVLEIAVTTATNIGDRAAVAQALNVIAIVEQRGGNLERAAELYVESRAQATAAGDRSLVAMIDQNAGTVANIKGDVSLALESFQKSLTGYQELGLSRYSGQVLNNMGLALVDLGDFTAADSAYNKALREFAVHGDRTLMDEVRVNQVQLWIATKQFEVALRQAKILLSRTDAGAMPWVGEVHRHIGVIAREKGDFNQANESLARAAMIARGSDDLLLSADVAEQQAELFWLEERHAEMLSRLNDARLIYARMHAETRVAQVERRNATLESRFLDIARTWGDSIEGADHYTQGHCERVAGVACSLAERVGIDSHDMFWFRLGALLHDVGKIIVPVEVLNKPGKLTNDEWALMKRHPVAGLELVSGIDFPGDVRSMIRSHHERWDGTGYPDGLAGELTPLPARLLCIADVYDALTSARPYRQALDHSQGVKIMQSSAGQFDPELLGVFLNWAEEQKACA
jgi:putative nucleotidyltransferase with HDIG domain